MTGVLGEEVHHRGELVLRVCSRRVVMQVRDKYGGEHRVTGVGLEGLDPKVGAAVPEAGKFLTPSEMIYQ